MNPRSSAEKRIGIDSGHVKKSVFIFKNETFPNFKNNLDSYDLKYKNGPGAGTRAIILYTLNVN